MKSSVCRIFWLQTCEAVWSNWKWMQSSESRFYLCKKYELPHWFRIFALVSQGFVIVYRNKFTHKTKSRCISNSFSISDRFLLSIVFSHSSLYFVQSVHLMKRFSCNTEMLERNNLYITDMYPHVPCVASRVCHCIQDTQNSIRMQGSEACKNSLRMHANHSKCAPLKWTTFGTNTFWNLMVFNRIIGGTCSNFALQTVSLVCDPITPSIFAGKSLRRIFLSDPIRLLKSYSPLPLPSAFPFSHTLNYMPQLRIASTSSSRWIDVLLLGALDLFSTISRCRASWTRLSINLSVWEKK